MNTSVRNFLFLLFLPVVIFGNVTPTWAGTGPGVEPPMTSEVPWGAPASTRTQTFSKSFESGDARLVGTLTLPAGAKHAMAAVVVTHGASSPLRTSPLYQHLTQMLPAMGIAVFTYDRRGSGQSSGTPSGFDPLADDANAAVAMLAKDHRIDPHRIGVWGLSQGGWLALLAASKSSQVAFVVSISAPLVTADKQMMFSSTNTLRVNGYSDTDIDQMRATRRAVDDYTRGHGSQAEAQSRVDAAKQKPWFKYLYMGDTIGEREVSGWRKEIEHDPLETLRAVRVPTLILYGAEDPVVPVAESIKQLDALVRKQPFVDVHVVSRADHSMQLDADPKVALDPKNADDNRPDAPEYFAILSSWLTGRGYAQRP